jgi:glycosyltransferase involved in cell wall biosynthesis
LTTEVIHPGGAETFVLRLSNALRKSGHKVHIFIFYEELFNESLYKMFAPNVPLLHAHIPLQWLLSKIDALLFRLNIDISLRNFFIKRSLKKLIRREKINVIHSNLLKTDKICLDVAQDFGIPVVSTIHGDYLQFYDKTKKQQKIPLLNYLPKATDNLQNLDEIICISDKQLKFFTEHFDSNVKNKLLKIYNGYDGIVSENNTSLRYMLNIPDDDFVFGMVSRGIAEKGWEIAIEAFLQLNKPNTHLVLVGESEYLRALKNVYAAHPNIHFTGHSDKPLDWIHIMNVGLLPTLYASESLPTVIIEYLCCGIPSIASDAGEIVNMIQVGDKKAGITVPIQNNTISVDGVKAAMEKYISDKAYYNEHCKNAAECYAQFDMDKCLLAYYNAYDDALFAKKEAQQS